MTLKQIRDAIIAIVGSDTELQNADYDVFINEGYTNIVAKILDERKDFFPGSIVMPVASGVTTFSPSSTVIRHGITPVTFSDIELIQVLRVNHSDEGWHTLRKESLEKVLGTSTDTSIVSGEYIYTMRDDTFYITNLGDDLAVRIYGYVVPAALSGDGDTPVFSTLLHPLLVTWGVGRAIEANSSSENFLDGGRKRQEFWDTLEQILPTVVLKDSTNVKSLI